MSIKHKLITGYGSLLLIILLFGVCVHFGILKFNKVKNEMAMRYEQLVDLEMVKNINTSLILEAMDLLVKKDEAVVYKEYTENVDKLFIEMFEFEKELLGDADTKAKVDLINEFINDYKIFEKTMKVDLPHLIVNIKTVDPVKFDELDDYIDGFGDEVADDIEHLKLMIEKELAQAETNLQEFEKEFNTFIILTVIFSFLLGLAIASYNIIKITKNIETFKNGVLGFFKYLNKETEDVSLLNTDSKDEIALMSKEINKNILNTKKLIEQDTELIKDVKSVVETVKKGILTKRIVNSTENESLEELKDLFNDMLDLLVKDICGDTNKIQKGIEEFQKLNFTHRIPNPTGKTSQGLNNLADIINDMLIENKKVGLVLGNSSELLLENVSTLNRVSNESAAAIEETSAALEEITNNITNNTDTILQMAEYAKELDLSAKKGEDLAKETTDAMNDINEEVSAINEAISIIDQISFQTNILSLNAAVEAATAGEVGKGFAVVAAEVRNLASRSAEAAKEIKDLVEKATIKADNGKEISTKMIDGYTTLNHTIESTINLIQNVENSSSEQKMGIQQINDAVNQLDRQTQENAAVSNNTHDVATRTDTIAHKVLESVDEKEFIGKDNIILEEKVA